MSEQWCGATTVFWPDDEGCEAECGLTLGHEPHNIHEDDILGRWDDREMVTSHPNEPDVESAAPETVRIVRRYLDGPREGHEDSALLVLDGRSLVLSPGPGFGDWLGEQSSCFYGFDEARGGYVVGLVQLIATSDTRVVRPDLKVGPSAVSRAEVDAARKVSS